MAKFERRESEIVDIFDMCIDRLMAGETLDTILADYPDYADELRSLLETGLLVHHAQGNGASADEVSAAQQQGRDKVVAALGSLPETEASGAKRRRPRVLQWVAMAAAAAFALGFGITLGVSNSLSAELSRDLQAAANEVAVVATEAPPVQRATDVFGAPLLTTAPSLDAYVEEATRLIAGATQTVAAASEATAGTMGIASTPTLELLMLSTPTPMPTMTVTATGTATVTFTPTGTAEPRATGTPFPTLGAVGASGLPTLLPPTAGAFSGGGDGGAAAPAPGGVASPSGMLIIPTEVASFYAMTPTLAPVGGEEAPADGSRDETERDDTGVFVPVSPPIIDGETSSELPPPQPQLQDYRNIELQPLKAGEIDDNADWDTYTEYRRNYMAIYPFGVIDLDVGGRQIIKIVDGAGKPILGAKVGVYAGATLIAETTTYATGMTLFFPNADPAYSRMDTFRVVVSKNGVTFEATLDIKRLDDTLTITLQ